MAWFEGSLIAFTNWFWNKRHPPAPKQRIQPTLDETPKKTTPKKTTPKPTSTAKKTKKTEWNVKE